LLQALVGRITVRATMVAIEVRLGALLEVALPGSGPVSDAAVDLPSTALKVPAQLKRTGLDNKLLVDAAPAHSREPDRSLLRLLAQAHRFWKLATTAQGRDMRELAREVGVSPSYFARVLRFAFLAPSITHAILQGCQPAELTANRLKNAGIVPASWPEQQRQFGLS
jgi:hypothetical protein